MEKENYLKTCSYIKDFCFRAAQLYVDHEDSHLEELATSICLTGEAFCTNGFNELSDQLFEDWSNLVIQLLNYLDEL